MMMILNRQLVLRMCEEESSREAFGRLGICSLVLDYLLDRKPVAPSGFLSIGDDDDDDDEKDDNDNDSDGNFISLEDNKIDKTMVIKWYRVSTKKVLHKSEEKMH